MMPILLYARRHGVALIMTLLILMILVTLVGQLSYSTKIDYYTAQNNQDELQTRSALQSAVCQAIAYLQLDYLQEKESREKFDALGDAWNKSHKLQLGNTDVTYTISDENAKFNLVNLLKEPKKQEGEEGQNPNPDKSLTYPEQFVRLVGLLQDKHKLVEPEELKDNILAWLKEKSGKTELEGPFLAKIPVLSVKELLLVKGITPMLLYGGTDKAGEKLAGMIAYFTVWSDGKVNINTAPAKLLQSLSSDLDADLAKRIVDYRDKPGNDGAKDVFKKEDEIKKVEGIAPDGVPDPVYDKIKDLITVRSHYFTIHAVAVSGRITKKMTVVVYRSGKRVHKLFCDEE